MEKTENRGGRREGSGRKPTGRKSVLIRLRPEEIQWLDTRQPTPRGTVIGELIKIAQEAFDS